MRLRSPMRLVLSQRDPDSRASLLASDLCPADGAGVLLICRMLGVPISARVAGSDLPLALQAWRAPGRDGPLRVALLVGEPRIGDLARETLNAGDTTRLICVAVLDPGVVTMEQVADPRLVKRINAAAVDFLLVALGAEKGQAWLLHNLKALKVPVSHLGATLNFLAGTVRRAPPGVQRLGLEWLWRVKEEPKLARRYLSDGGRLMWLLLTRVLRLSVWLRWPRAGNDSESGVSLDVFNPALCTVTVGGVLRDEELAPVIKTFRSAGQSNRNVQLDFSRLKYFQMGFAGQVLMLEKSLQRQGRSRLQGRRRQSPARSSGAAWDT